MRCEASPAPLVLELVKTVFRVCAIPVLFVYGLRWECRRIQRADQDSDFSAPRRGRVACLDLIGMLRSKEPALKILILSLQAKQQSRSASSLCQFTEGIAITLHEIFCDFHFFLKLSMLRCDIEQGVRSLG